MDTIYLDNAATTPLSDEVREAMAPWLGAEFGNPSSRHPLGVRAAEALDRARAEVASALGARPSDVIFTSGGTEANNLGVLGLARARARAKLGRHVLVGPTEHSSVREAALALRDEGFQVEFMQLDGGMLDLDDAARRLRRDTVLVACMRVHNELGTVYDVPRLARLVRANAPAARLHVDAIQAVGKIPVTLGELGAHSLTLSAHKLHGPKGAGALVRAPGVRPRPLLYGGGQEHGVRSGTENVAGIVGLGTAVRLAVAARADSAVRLEALRTRFLAGVRGIEGLRPLEVGTRRSPAILALRLDGPPAEVWMHHLEQYGVMTSVGSACLARGGELSPGLLALGLSEAEVRQVLRVSFSTALQEAELDLAARAFAEVARRLAATA